MKSITTLLTLALFSLSSFAGEIVTSTLTVTNVPASGNTLTVNGSARTWTNNATGSETIAFLIGADVGSSATNMFNAIALYGYAGPVQVSRTGSNTITLRAPVGSPLVVSGSGAWLSVTNSTNTTTAMYPLMLPVSSYSLSTSRTNAANDLTSALSLSTTPLASSSLLLSNFFSLDGNKVVTGDNLFTGLNTFSNANQLWSGGTISNATFFGDGMIITLDGGFYAVKNTNNKTLFYVSPTTGAVWIGQLNGIYPQIAVTTNSFAVMGGSAFTKFLINNTNGAFYSDGGSISSDGLGNLAAVSFIGNATSASTASNIVSGSSVTNITQVSGTQVNSILSSNTTVKSDLAFMKLSNSSLVAGNNAGVNISTNVYVTISGPAGAFTINGIAGGRDGRYLILRNATAYTMTLANSSGIDPTAANRISTGTGADLVCTNGATLIYDASSSLWFVVSSR